MCNVRTVTVVTAGFEPVCKKGKLQARGTEMRKSIIAVVAAIGLGCTAQPAPAQTADQVKQDFELVESIGSRRAYEVFLSTHRTGPYADRAREHLRKLYELDGKADAIFNQRLIERQRK
jgi:hypothetical protein